MKFRNINEIDDVDIASSKLEKKLTKAKYKAFGKCKYKKNLIYNKVSKLMNEKKYK